MKKKANWLSILMLASGCATHEVAHHWPGAYQRVLVAVWDNEKHSRSDCETEIAGGMRQRAVDATAASAISATKDDPLATLAGNKIDCLVLVIADNGGSKIGVYDVRQAQFVRVFTNSMNVFSASRADLHGFGEILALTLEQHGLLDPKQLSAGARFADGLGKGIGKAFANRYPVTSAVVGGSVSPNAYGLGVNADSFGRPHQYRLQNGEPLDTIFQGGVKRNAYGPCTHMDQFGRPVYDSAP